MEVSGKLHAPATLPPGKEPVYTLDSRLGGLQSRSGRGGDGKNSQPLLGLEPRVGLKLMLEGSRQSLNELLFRP
jgi:hypothetical protein